MVAGYSYRAATPPLGHTGRCCTCLYHLLRPCGAEPTSLPLLVVSQPPDHSSPSAVTFSTEPGCQSCGDSPPKRLSLHDIAATVGTTFLVNLSTFHTTSYFSIFLSPSPLLFVSPYVDSRARVVLCSTTWVGILDDWHRCKREPRAASVLLLCHDTSQRPQLYRKRPS